MATTTLLTIVQDIADSLGLRESGTATGGSASTLVCASFPYKTSNANVSASRYVGCSVLPTAGTYVALERGVATYAPSTGTFTVDSTWAGALAGTETFDIYKKGVYYQDITAAVNRALRKLHYLKLLPLTLVSDGDMELSATTSWTASNTTHSKVATSTAGTAWRGGYVSRCVNSVAEGYIRSNTVSCSPNDSFYLEARCAALVGTGRLQAYDMTNSASIEYEDWDDIGPGIVSFTFTAPSTCEQIAVRLVGVEASADCYWDDVVLFRMTTKEMPLPTTVILPTQLRGVYRSEEEEDFDEQILYSIARYSIAWDDLNASGQIRVFFPDGITRPHWVRALVPYGTLSTYSSTTLCDRDLIVAGGRYELLNSLSRRAPGQETDTWKEELPRARFELIRRVKSLTPVSLRYEYPL